MYSETYRDYTKDPQFTPLLEMSTKMGDLNKEQESDLVLMAQAGDKVAMETLVISNIRFCFKQATLYTNRGIELDDLFSEAMAGMVRAIEKFEVDHKGGARLLTYAKWWVYQSIMICIYERRQTIRLGRAQNAVWRKVSPLYYEHDERRRSLSYEDIAEETGYNPKLIAFLSQNMKGQTSLNTGKDIGKPDSKNELNIIGALKGGIKCSFEDRDQAEWLDRVMQDALSEREYKIVRAYFWEGETLNVIGDRFGVTREAIRQAKNKAFKKVRSLIRQQDMSFGITPEQRSTMLEVGDCNV